MSESENSTLELEASGEVIEAPDSVNVLIASKEERIIFALLMELSAMTSLKYTVKALYPDDWSPTIAGPEVSGKYCVAHTIEYN